MQLKDKCNFVQKRLKSVSSLFLITRPLSACVSLCSCLAALMSWSVCAAGAMCLPEPSTSSVQLCYLRLVFLVVCNMNQLIYFS